MDLKSDQILKSRKEIWNYLDIRSENFWRALLARQFPATVIGGRWFAHKGQIDTWFRDVTINCTGEGKKSEEQAD